MSTINFNFDITPTYFRKNGFFKSDNTLKFVSWCFARCYSIEREVYHDGRYIVLKPFQFIFGRYVCSKETNMSEDEVRTQQKIMENSGLLKKCPNKTPKRFTIYEWVTTRFSENNPQVNPQETPKKPPRNPHNIDNRSIDLKDSSPQTPNKKKNEEKMKLSKKSIDFSKACKKENLPFTERLLAEFYELYPQATVDVCKEFYKKKKKDLDFPDEWLKKHVTKQHEYLEQKKDYE
jgi:hypothetical protein